MPVKRKLLSAGVPGAGRPQAIPPRAERPEANAPQAGLLQALAGLALSGESALRRTAQWIADHQDQAAGLSITDLAAAIGVSETTVFRLCRALGFDGYRALRLALAEHRGLARGTRLALPPGAAPTNGAGAEPVAARIARRIIEADAQALFDTLHLIDPAMLEQATQQLLEARHIYLLGFGSSFPVATDAYQRFLRLGLVASAHCDPHVLAALASNPPPDSLFFAITYSGQTRDIVETLETAGRRGCTRIVLTGNPRGPVTELAETVLLSAVRRSGVVRESIATRISQLAVIDMLCAGLALRHARSPDFLYESALFEREIAKKRLPAKRAGAARGREP